MSKYVPPITRKDTAKSHRYESRPIEDRLFERVVEDDNGCWNWSGTQNGSGYGLLKHCGKCTRRVMAHRVAYELLIGDIPDGLYTDHLCRNRACVNPYHLEPVPNGLNVLRGTGYAARNNRKTHCLRNHPLTAENLLISGGRRVCRTCKRNREQDRMSRKRATA